MTDLCQPGGYIGNNPTLSARTYVFISISFSCDGYITHWKFYAKNTGTFYPTIWRPDGNSYRVHAWNEIVVDTVGEQVNIVENTLLSHYHDYSTSSTQKSINQVDCQI